MSKASQDSMDALHGALADKLTDLLDGVTDETKGAAAILNVARQFLKDNGIDSVAAAPGSALGGLQKKVTEFPFDPAEPSTYQ